MTSAYHDHASRAAFMASALAAGTGRRVAGTQGLADAAVARTATALCTDTIQSIPTTALTAERIAATLSYAVPLLTPFLTGHGFPGGAGPAIPIPTPAQTARVIGYNTSY
jgi:hypothetical protein